MEAGDSPGCMDGDHPGKDSPAAGCADSLSKAAGRSFDRISSGDSVRRHYKQGRACGKGKLAALADFPVGYEQSENLQEVLKAMDFHVDLSDLESHEALCCFRW